MKFAFSTVACPEWNFERIIEAAGEYGYEGVEIRAFLNETVLTAANVFLSDLDKVRGMFESAGVQIACLASSIAYSGSKRADARAADDLRTYIDTARRLGCGVVKIFDTQVRPGQSRLTAAVALGDWLLPLGDYAAERNVLLVVENALSFRAAKEMWTILDRLNHPSIACCWDVFNAAVIGETPYVSVPVLNSRIQYVHVKDAHLGPMGASFCKLGEGDVPVQSFLIRLRGIGYSGWVTVDWEKAWLPGLAEPEEILPHSIEQLRTWTTPVEVTKKGGRPKAQPAQAATSAS